MNFLRESVFFFFLISTYKMKYNLEYAFTDVRTGQSYRKLGKIKTKHLDEKFVENIFYIM